MITQISTIFRRRSPCVSGAFLLLAFGTTVSQTQPAQLADTAQGQGLQPILGYISNAWDTLTRSMTECQSVVDTKVATAPVLYLPANFPEPPAVKKLAAECNVRVEHLPIEIHTLGEIDTDKIQPPGLLYLETLQRDVRMGQLFHYSRPVTCRAS
jgi:hypothetical protein